MSELEVRSPFDGRAVARLPYDDGPRLEEKIERAREAQREWRDVPLERRVALVEAGVRRFTQMREEIARGVSLQMGKPIAQSRREVDTLAERAEHCLAIAASALGSEVIPERPGFHLRIDHVPLGVVLDLAAWNYPLVIPVNVVVPALLAGNSVLLKHSARTPLCGRAFAEAFGQLGEVRDLVTDLVLTHETVARLVADERIAHVAFTGSVEGGLEVYRTAASRPIEVGLELGGKDPAYVAEDADLDFAAENIVDGACYNAGQSCCAVERVYVHRRHLDAFVERARAHVEAYELGDPLDDRTTMGPLASRAALDFLEAQVEDARARGATVVSGGRRDAAGEGFFSPTLMVLEDHGAEVLREESFGPLVPVVPVDGDDEAVQRMNDTRYGLTASVWTRDRERAERFAREVDAGTVFQNRCDYLDPALPWTGYGDSGKGSTLSRYGFHHLTKRKSIHFRDPAS